jgi:hypothetical protein
MNLDNKLEQSPKLDRRQFMKLAASMTVAAITTTACSRDNGTDARTLGSSKLLEMLGPERVRTIGAHYRARVPTENSVSALRAAISEERSRLHLPWLQKSIDDTVHEDFAAGRTVVVDGWVLAVTEARQCALFSLASA